MIYHFPGTFAGQSVTFTFNPSLFQEANCALVFAFLEGRLLFTRHRQRGWEIPGGTRIAGEWIIQTALRELYEETGAEAIAIEPVAQYWIDAPEEPRLVKTVFAANLKALHPRPEGFETDSVRLFPSIPSPQELLVRSDFSPLVKDRVYELVAERLRNHPYVCGMQPGSVDALPAKEGAG